MDWIQKRLSGSFQKGSDERPKSPTSAEPTSAMTPEKPQASQVLDSPSPTFHVHAPNPASAIPGEVEGDKTIATASPREGSPQLGRTVSPRNRISGHKPSLSNVSSLKTSGSSSHKRTVSDEDSDSQSHQTSRSDHYRRALEEAHDRILESQREFDRRLHVLTSALEEKAEQNVSLTLSNDDLQATLTDLNSQVKSLTSGNQLLQQKFESEMALTKEFMNKITSLTNMIDSLSKENVKLKVEIERLTSLPPPLNTNFSSNPGFSAKDIDRVERGVSRDDIEVTLPSSLAIQINSRSSQNPARHTSPRYPFVNSPKFSPRGAPFGSPGKENGFLSEIRLSELEKEVRDLKNELLMSMSREDGLNESLDIYEKELRRVKTEARVNLELEGYRREELQLQVKRLQQRVEELEFLVDETSETTFDASEVDDESFEDDLEVTEVADLGGKIENVSIPGQSGEASSPAAKPSRSPKSSPQSSRSTSPRTSVDLTRGLGGSPVIHRRGRSFDLGDKLTASPMKNLNNSNNGQRRYGHQRNRSTEATESPSKSKAVLSDLKGILEQDFHTSLEAPSESAS